MAGTIGDEPSVDPRDDFEKFYATAQNLRAQISNTNRDLTDVMTNRRLAQNSVGELSNQVGTLKRLLDPPTPDQESRYYHGTKADFDKYSAAMIDDWGALGRGLYGTSDPVLASSYATGYHGMDPEGGNVRPMIVPRSLNLFDISGNEVTPPAQKTAIFNKLLQTLRNLPSAVDFERVRNDFNRPMVQTLIDNRRFRNVMTEALRSAIPYGDSGGPGAADNVFNDALEKAGYHGILDNMERHIIGDHSPDVDNHRVVLIFPQHLEKIYNGLTGQPSAWTDTRDMYHLTPRGFDVPKIDINPKGFTPRIEQPREGIDPAKINLTPGGFDQSQVNLNPGGFTPMPSILGRILAMQPSSLPSMLQFSRK